MSSSKNIVLNSSDGEKFEIDEIVAQESQTIKHMIDVKCVDTPIPLPKVTSSTLSKVIEYCKKHVEARKAVEEELKAFDAEFVKLDQSVLFDLVLAADYLNIKNLLHLTCQTVTDRIKRKSKEEIYEIFNVKNDFTPEEEEELINSYQCMGF